MGWPEEELSVKGGVVMAFYSVLLIVLNRRALPGPIKLGGWRLAIMALISVFFGSLSLYLVYDYVSRALTGQL